MHIRVVATRARKFMPQIEADLVLVRKLLERYDRAKSCALQNIFREVTYETEPCQQEPSLRDESIFQNQSY